MFDHVPDGLGVAAILLHQIAIGVRPDLFGNAFVPVRVVEGPIRAVHVFAVVANDQIAQRLSLLGGDLRSRGILVGTCGP